MYKYKESRKLAVPVAICLYAMLLGFVRLASAQTQVAGVTLNGSGSLGYAYSAAFGNNDFRSNHYNGLIANMNLNGFYFHPRFLSFTANPYFDRSQTNVESQVVQHSNGVGTSVSLFSGSNYPISISWGKGWSSNSEFQMAGIPSLYGDSASQTFNISWSATPENYPSLTASFGKGSGTSTATGIDGESKSSSSIYSLGSSYSIAGFHLNGAVSHSKANFSTPVSLLAVPIDGQSATTTYSASGSHKVPFSGSMSASWSRSYSDNGNGMSGVGDNYLGTLTNRFFNRLSVGQSVSYNTNLSQSLNATVLDGQIAAVSNPDNKASGLSYSVSSGYTLFRRVSISGYYNFRQQWWGNRDRSDRQFGATINYDYRSGFLGMIYFGLGVVDVVNEYGNTGLGIVANVGMNRRFGKWETSADFSHNQGVQTLGTLATTSNFSYGGSVRRKFSSNGMSWGLAAREAHSGFGMNGNNNRSETISSTMRWGKYSMSTGYSQSHGTAVLTTSGELISTPLAPVLTDQFMYFDGRSFYISGSTVLRRKINVSGGYSYAFSGSSDPARNVEHTGRHYTASVGYRLRKFMIAGNYARSEQMGALYQGRNPVLNSYSLSLSRWFNLF